MLVHDLAGAGVTGSGRHLCTQPVRLVAANQWLGITPLLDTVFDGRETHIRRVLLTALDDGYALELFVFVTHSHCVSGLIRGTHCRTNGGQKNPGRSRESQGEIM